MEISEDAEVRLPNLNDFMREIFDAIPVIVAAGGFVLNTNSQLLMIHRRGSWDLPKGKMEADESLEETAVREVEEECGISQLNITSKGFDSYHLYVEGDHTVVKRSVWFKMSTSTNEEPTPQTEEDILESCWVDLPVSKEILNGAYPSIVEVIDHFMSLVSSETSGG